MIMGDFRYSRAQRHVWATWYCQRPGKHWATDPVLGYSLEWRRRNPRDGTFNTGWHLFSSSANSAGFDGEYVGRRFHEALFAAVELITDGRDPAHTRQGYRRSV